MGALAMALKWQMMMAAAKRTYTVNIYSDPGHGLVSVDGTVRRTGWFLSWSNVHNGVGTEAYPDATVAVAAIQGETQPWPLWHMIQRAIMTFAIPSDLPAAPLITKAEYKFYVDQVYDNLNCSPAFGLVESHPAAPNNLVPLDYQALDSTPISTVLDYGDVVAHQFNTLEVLPAYLSLIVPGSVLQIGLREMNYDVANIAPPWLPNCRSGLDFLTVDHADPDLWPYLELTIDP